MFTTIDQAPTIKSLLDESILTWRDSFLIDKRAEGLSPNTLRIYQRNLNDFLEFCNSQGIETVQEITPHSIRLWMMFLEEKGHNAGGRHGHYRVVRTFLYWYENEVEPDNWKNPIKKVNAPKLPVEPIQPIELQEFDKLLRQAKTTTFPERDTAILLTLLDTGARAHEFTALTLNDINLATGSILIRQGKGRKTRTVFIGKRSRRAIRAYLKTRNDTDDFLWITSRQTQLTISGLRQIIRRLSEKAGITEHGAHDFRRAFALNMLRNGCDIFTLARLMGHSSIQVLQRYLAQTNADSERAHRNYGFVDEM